MGKTSEAPKGARLFVRAAGLSAALSAALLLGSCDSVNEGISDYRKAYIDSTNTEAHPTDITRKYELTGSPDAKGDSRSDIPIVEGNRFYVSLLQAYAGDDAGFGANFILQSKEELIVVLRVRDSNDPDNKEGRFVFYSDDVKPNQYLNFSNLLTLGPTTYKGGVITIDLDEIRVKRSTVRIKALLDELTANQDDAVGPDPVKRRTWHASARDVFDMIDSDAYGTRYTLTLMPSGGVVGLPYPRFEAGNYVLMRHRRGNSDVDWNCLKLDNNTGRLIAPGTLVGDERLRNPNLQGSCGDKEKALPANQLVEYHGNSYVTLQINALRVMPTPVLNKDVPITRFPPETVTPPTYKPVVPNCPSTSEKKRADGTWYCPKKTGP